ncbi:hypothetical protein KAH55_11655, partial [bacterium]|nr:hypothetical protein [bacterium]
RHRAEMTTTLSSYAERLEQQRLADLQLIGTSIEQFQQRNDHHIQQTNQSLDGIRKVMQVSAHR